MAVLVTRDLPDVLVDRIVAKITAFEVAQAALDPLVGFDTERDSFTPISRKRTKPLANVYFQTLTPAQSGSAARSTQQESASITIDMIVNEPDPNSLIPGQTADKIAEARLHYFRAQIWEAIFELTTENYGFPRGALSQPSLPTYSKLESDDDNAEEAEVAGRWQLSFDYARQPLDGLGVPLEEITIDTSLFQALYVYPEAP